MTILNPPLTFVSNSEAKLDEYRKLLGMPSLLRAPMPDAESTTTNLGLLVREKCEKAARHVDPPLFVEHTALAIDALNGLPGVITQPFLSMTSNRQLLEMMAKEKGADRAATAKIAIGYLESAGARVKLIEAQTRGYISTEPRGKQGFGWDEIFVPEGESKTYAEMSIEEKNRSSMRAKIADSFKIALSAPKSEMAIPDPATYRLDKPPDSIWHLVLAVVWPRQPWLRYLVLILLGVGVLSFTLWASLPDATKQRLIDWLTHFR